MASPLHYAASQRLEALQSLPVRSSAGLRREQLVKIAAHIVECEGLDALRHARIAELAGCARPLVYNYFPRRGDILIAISEAFYQRLAERFSCEEQYRALQGALEGSPEAALEMQRLIWDVLDEFGCAGMLLRCSPEISDELRQYHGELRQRHEHRWLRYFEALGLAPLRAQLLLDNCSAISKNAALAYLNGSLAREDSIRLVQGQLAALVRCEIRAARAAAGEARKAS